MSELPGDPSSEALARGWSPLLEALPVGVLLADGAGRVLRANPAALRILGLGREALRARSLEDLAAWLDPAGETGALAPPDREPIRKVLCWARDAGETIWLDWAAQALGADQILVSFEDITESRFMAARLERLTQLYAALSQVNQAIVLSPSRPALLDKICEVMVEHGRFSMAWIGLDDPRTHEVEVASQYGDEHGALVGLRVRSDDTPLGQGAAGRAIREGRPHIFNDFYATAGQNPWFANARRSGIRAVAAFPFHTDGRVIGALTVYAKTADYFGPEECALLEEAAGDMSFALEHLELADRRRAAEDELARAQANVTALIESTRDMIWSVDREHRLLIYNTTFADHFLNFYGTTPHPGAAPESLLPPERAAMWAPLYEKAFKEGPFSQEIGLPDGRILEVLFHPIRGDQEVLGASVFGKDITARKRAEGELREALEFNQKLLGAGPMGVQAFHGGTGQCVLATEGVVRIVGGSLPQLLAQNFRELTSWRGNGLLEAAERALATGEDQFLEPRVRTTFQRELWLSCTFTTFLAHGEKHLLLTLFDSTERKSAEAALRDSEERYRTQFELSTEGILALSTEGRILDVNEAFARMHGYRREEILAMRLEDLDTPESFRHAGERIRRILAREDPLFEVEHRHKDGHAFPLEVSAGLVHIGGRDIILNYHRDITERKRTEAAQQQAQKLESLGVLAGGIAHDFNNLLTAIMGNLNLAQDKVGEHSPARPHLEKVENTVLKAAELSRQMLAYSGKGHFVVKPRDLNAIIEEMTGLLAASLPKKIQLELHLAPILPLFKADGAQIQQVVMNLITNAAEAIGDQDGTIAVTTFNADLDREVLSSGFPGQPMEAGSYLVLSVADSGCGMDALTRSRIFDPFFTTKASGRGLGLSAMLGILKGHKAGIRIQSELGLGTIFEVFFPALGEAEALEDLPPSRRERRMAGTVLLVDDEEMILDSTAPALESLGFRVVKARDGVQALERFIEMGKDLALVFMDLSMPRMDGISAFLAMRRNRPEVPVILSSGYDQMEATEDLLAQGLAGFVQKPYRIRDLARELDRVLGGNSH